MSNKLSKGFDDKKIRDTVYRLEKSINACHFESFAQ